jgi:hypothetical protein
MRDDWEALSDGEQREKARAIVADIETLQDAPESLKDDVAALVGEDSYEAAVEELDTSFTDRL